MVKFKVELIKEFNIVKAEAQEEDPAILESTGEQEESAAANRDDKPVYKPKAKQDK